MDIEMRHLRWFLVLAEELHFGRAAALLHISQSTLSKGVARLEKVVGAELFVRDHRAVALTPAGEAFQEGAAAAIRSAQDAVVAARATTARGGKVRLGYGIAFEELAAVLRAVRSREPKLEVELVSYLYRDVTGGLASGETHVAFTMPYLDLPGIDFLPLGAESRVLLVPQGHPASTASEVSLAGLSQLLRSETWLLPAGSPPRGTRSFRRFWAGLDAVDEDEPTSTRTFDSNEELAQMLAEGDGLALGLTSLVPRYTLPSIVAVPVPELPPGLLGLAYRHRAPRHVQRFIRVARGLRADVAPPGTVVAATTTIR